MSLLTILILVGLCMYFSGRIGQLEKKVEFLEKICEVEQHRIMAAEYDEPDEAWETD